MISDTYRYEEDYTVAIHMTDGEELCRPANTLRFLQETAIHQLDRFGPSSAHMLETGRAFLISRISMDFLHPLRVYDRIRAATWPCSTSRGVSFDRCYELHLKQADGTLLPAARASSQWAVIDIATRHLIRVADTELTYSCADTTEVSIPPRFRIPKDAVLEEAGTHTVRYSDIDRNRHMNNTHYPDLFCDFLPMDGKWVSAMAIAFLAEAPLYDTLRMTCTEAPDEKGLYYMRSYRMSDGAVNAEAAVRLLPLTDILPENEILHHFA